MSSFTGFKYLLLLISIYFFPTVLSAPTDDGPAVDPNIAVIEAAAEALPESSFLGDQELVQKADRVNGLTSYRHPEGGKHTKIVFNRKKSDNGKKVVVLGTGEDHLKHSSVKRTYVVLRQSPSDPKIYRPFYAYVRNAKPEDTSTVAVGDQKRIIEFDTWDARGSSKNAQRSLGWTDCQASVYPPCKNSVVESVELEKKDPHEVEYSQEEESSENHNEDRPKSNRTRVQDTKMQSDSGVDVPSYYDFFVDLDECATGIAYVVKTVGTYVYSLSAATLASPPETLLMAGIRPTELSHDLKIAAEVWAMKQQDMKLAVGLFKLINNDTSPIEADSLPTVGGPSSAAGRSADKVDPARLERLKGQYATLLEQLENLQKIYPNPDINNATAAPAKPVGNGTVTPHEQLNLLKAKAVSLVERIGPKGNSVLDVILETSEVGQELKDNPQEGQDLLNDQDPIVLKELEDEVEQQVISETTTAAPALKDGLTRPTQGAAGRPPQPTQGASGRPTEVSKTTEAIRPSDPQMVSDHQKKKEILLNKLRKAKSEKRTLRNLNEKIRLRSAALRDDAPRKGGLLGGVLVCLLGGNGRNVSKQTGRSAAEEEDPLAGLLGGMIAGSMGGMGDAAGGGLLGTIMSLASKSGLIEDLMGPVMEAINGDGSFSYMKLVTGVGGTLVNKGISKIPIVGGPLSMLTGLLGKATAGAKKLVGMGGRSVGETTASETELSDTNLFGLIGWRTSDINSEELASHSPTAEEGFPFIGFGNCPQKHTTLADFESSKTTDEVVLLYTFVLRTQCSAAQKHQIAKLFAANLLILNPDKTLSVNEAWPLLQNQKLTKAEEADLSSAFEIAMFSQALISEWKKRSPPTNPDGSKITQTTHTFIKAALNGIDQGRRILPRHFIKLARNADVTLKTGLTKLLQDYDRYKACSKCPGEIMTVAKNDLLGVTGVMQFIMAGLGPVDRGTKDATTAYKDFFTLNKAALEDKIKPFL